MTIAGHSFLTDTRCQRICGCGIRWTQIAATPQSDIGKPDIAHSGTLAAFEWTEIQSEVDRIWNHTMSIASTPGYSNVDDGNTAQEAASDPDSSYTYLGEEFEDHLTSIAFC